MQIITRLWIAISLAISCLSHAQTGSEYSIGGTETLTIKSEINQQQYELYIKLPRSYSYSEKSYPIAILNDTNFSFPIASGVATLMGGRDIKDLILVGISYSKGTPAQTSRTRDYTPTYAPDEKGAHSLEAQRYSGRANQYIKFIEHEVIPLIAKKYRIDERNRTFIGHSFGGLLGTYILLTKPELFENYIIGSPSLWYDRHAIFNLEEEYSKGNKSMKANVFMYIGSEETGNRNKNMVKDLLRYERILKSRNYSGLNVSAHVFEGASHHSVFSMLLSDGLKKAIPKVIE